MDERASADVSVFLLNLQQDDNKMIEITIIVKKTEPTIPNLMNNEQWRDIEQTLFLDVLLNDWH